jgi:hypothetical protein
MNLLGAVRDLTGYSRRVGRAVPVQGWAWYRVRFYITA